MSERRPHNEHPILNDHVIAITEDYGMTPEEAVESVMKEIRIAVERTIKKIDIPEDSFNRVHAGKTIYHAVAHFLVPFDTAEPFDDTAIKVAQARKYLALVEYGVKNSEAPPLSHRDLIISTVLGL